MLAKTVDGGSFNLVFESNIVPKMQFSWMCEGLRRPVHSGMVKYAS